MSKSLVFTCPVCGEHSVEEVVSCNQASYLITRFEDDGSIVYADAELDDDAMTECYRCCSCGHILADVTKPEELKKYMK